MRSGSTSSGGHEVIDGARILKGAREATSENTCSSTRENTSMTEGMEPGMPGPAKSF